MATLVHDVTAAREERAARGPAPYLNPYLAGVGLGLVLLLAFVTMGRGLGASGAFSAVLAWLLSLAAPGYAARNEFLSPYLEGPTHPLKAWLVFEVAGVLLGAFLSGLLARRVIPTVERGPRVSPLRRLAFAFCGGALMAVGAHLNAGSWAFMMCVFGGAYAVAWLFRREWR
jgi:hypothetical protein